MKLKSLKNFAIGFGTALVLYLLFFLTFVRPCNVYSTNPSEEKRCRCLGKTVNVEAFLGTFRSKEDTSNTRAICIGLVRERY